MARFNGGTLEDLFDDAPRSERAAVRSEIDAASVAADGAAMALDERAAELDAEADRDNVFACDWRELIEAQADPALDAFADDWDLMADRARAIMARTLPAPETILARLLGRRNKRAAGKAAQAIVEGVKIRREGDALYIASQSEAGREWRVDANGCGCRATGACLHGEVFAVTLGWEG